MKILIVLPDLHGGGAERLHVNLARHWTDLGHDVDFILLRKSGDLLKLVPDKVNIISINAYRIRQAVIPIYKILKKIKPDVVLSAMWPLTSITVISWIISRRKSKLFLSDHVVLSLDSTNNIGVPILFLKFFIFITYHFSNGIIAVSKGVKEDLCSLGRIPAKKVEVIYNPAAIGISKKDFINYDNLWQAKHEKKILSVGSLKYEKDHKSLIKAVSLIKDSIDIKLIILGDGPLRRDLECLVKSLGMEKNVSLPGFQINPYPWYLSSDLFVLSSKWEGFGNVIVEALECGIPVVSTDCPGGVQEILDNGRYGRLVRLGSVTALADAIKESLNQKHDIFFLKERAKKFSIQEISKQYLNFFTGRV